MVQDWSVCQSMCVPLVEMEGPCGARAFDTQQHRAARVSVFGYGSLVFAETSVWSETTNCNQTTCLQYANDERRLQLCFQVCFRLLTPLPPTPAQRARVPVRRYEPRVQPAPRQGLLDTRGGGPLAVREHADRLAQAS